MLHQLKNRYVITGRIVMETALHVGGGDGEGQITDSPALKGADGNPLIPGSSIKGAFRAAVERILSTLGYSPCFLFENNDVCLTTDEKKRRVFEKNRKAMNEQEIVSILQNSLCPACLLFGSPFSAGRVSFADAHLNDDWMQTEIRHGVGIDRDSGRSVDGVLFDYEVVPAGSSFAFSALAVNLNPLELGMLGAGLQEMRGGYIPLGGLKTRGLGKCTLEITSLEILDVLGSGDPDLEALRQYLKTRKGTVISNNEAIDGLLNDWIDSLLGGLKGA